MNLDRTLRGRVATFYSPQGALPRASPRGRPWQSVPVIVALISVHYKSLKPPDPGATSQGPAGGAYGRVCLLVATYISRFPLRVKHEPCVG